MILFYLSLIPIFIYISLNLFYSFIIVCIRIDAATRVFSFQCLTFPNYLRNRERTTKLERRMYRGSLVTANSILDIIFFPNTSFTTCYKEELANQSNNSNVHVFTRIGCTKSKTNQMLQPTLNYSITYLITAQRATESRVLAHSEFGLLLDRWSNHRYNCAS